jgi:flagellar basal-body rod protein FlgF
MDRLIYTAMSGAKALMQRQDALSNNLANAATTGFRADTMSFRSVPVRAPGTATTRVANLEATAGFDVRPGPIQQTGNPLDVAVLGQGWIAVQGLDGMEAYTRNGSLVVGADGRLQTQSGLPVVGDGGPISLEPNAQVTIGADGTVSARYGRQPPTTVGRIKLVNPPAGQLGKGSDGLARVVGGDPAPTNPAVRLASGALEGSNVNVVEAMVGMIALSRQFEVQMKLMQTTETNEQKATQLLSLKS